MELIDFHCFDCGLVLRGTHMLQYHGVLCPKCNKWTVMPCVKKKEKTIQESAKEKVISLLSEYDVAFIDYDAKEDEYSIRLDKEKIETNTAIDGGNIFVDGVKLTDG